MPTLTPQTENINFPLPRVTIDRLVLERIRRYVGQCNTEISGFGFAVQNGDHFHIMDARVCKQDAVSGAHTDINKDALNQLMFEWKDRDGILVWWHSHVNMDTFWSHQDRSTIMDLGKNGMALAVVFNKRHEQRCAMSFKASLPFTNDPQVIMLDDLRLMATIDTPVDTLAAWDKELADALPPPSANPTQGKWADDDWGGHYRGYDMVSGNWNKEDFWEDAQVGAANDIDWAKGTHWIEGMGWRKSWQQRQKEKAEKQAGTTLVTIAPDVDESFIVGRRKVALLDDDIVMYHPLSDEYELVNGVMVDAQWYLNSVDQDNWGMSEQDVNDLYSQLGKEKSRA